MLAGHLGELEALRSQVSFLAGELKTAQLEKQQDRTRGTRGAEALDRQKMGPQHGAASPGAGEQQPNGEAPAVELARLRLEVARLGERAERYRREREGQRADLTQMAERAAYAESLEAKLHGQGLILAQREAQLEAQQESAAEAWAQLEDQRKSAAEAWAQLEDQRKAAAEAWAKVKGELDRLEAANRAAQAEAQVGTQAEAAREEGEARRRAEERSRGLEAEAVKLRALLSAHVAEAQALEV